MGRRCGSHGHDTWSIPGGHLEFDESLEDCAKREALEETGLTVENVTFLALTEDRFPEHNKHYITIWVCTDWIAGEPAIAEPDKWVDQKWRDFQTLPSPLFEPCWQNLKKQSQRFSLDICSANVKNGIFTTCYGGVAQLVRAQDS